MFQMTWSGQVRNDRTGLAVALYILYARKSDNSIQNE